MSRLVDALVDNEAYAKGSPSPMLNLGNGGQFGWTPDGKAWVSNQAYLRQNLICLLLQAPKFFTLMSEPQKWTDALKALVELHPRSIEGLNAGLTVDMDEHPVGGSLEQHQEPTNVTRARSEPSFTYHELYGRPIQTLISKMIRYGIADPNTKVPLIATHANAPTDMLADWFTFSCIFIEPDPTGKKSNKAWLGVNMMPKGTGEIIGKRDLTTAKEITTLTIEFSGIYTYGEGSDGINLFAQQILDSISLVNADPNAAPSFISEISADVKAGSAGYSENIAKLSASAITA